MTLIDLLRMDDDAARAYLERVRWPSGPVCALCGSAGPHYPIKANLAHKVRGGLYKCREKECAQTFTVTTNTVMHGSHLPMSKWAAAFYLMCDHKKGVSALQLQRDLGLGSYRTAWHMAHRIREAMRHEPLKGMLEGVVQVDESRIGGKRENMHAKKRQPLSEKWGGSQDDKPILMALVERGGRAKVKVIANVTGKTLKAVMDEGIKPTATIWTDDHKAYKGAANGYAAHKTVAHMRKEYVLADGTTTNEVEGFFGLFKRGVVGSFHSVSRQHLERYAGEFAFRWSHRKVTDGERTEKAIRGATGVRLTYKAPIEG